MPNEHGDYTLPAVDSGSVLLVLQGQATVSQPHTHDTLCAGHAFFIAANQLTKLHIVGDTNLVMFRAYCLHG